MPFRDPLSFDTLRDIQARRRGDPDVKALLWEVFRMQATLLRVDQLSRSAMPWSGCMGGIWQEVVESLKHEPACVKQRERVRPDHFPPHWK